jgi:hypothetical protein
VELISGQWSFVYVNCIINIPGIPSSQTAKPIRLLRSQKGETPPHAILVIAETFSKRHLTLQTGHPGIWTFHTSEPVHCEDAKH